MRIAILSDLHANTPALRAVLEDLRRAAVQHVLCLGDLVGYNCFPRETLALLRERGIPTVYGNHDLMAIGRLRPDGCGPIARAAIAWTRRILTDDERLYLASLPLALRPRREILCVHSALGDTAVRLSAPAQFREQALRLRRFDPDLEICFTGHTHAPQAVEVTPGGEVRIHVKRRTVLRPGVFWFVNPGSVGHPRGRDLRATYAVLDEEERSAAFRRVAYDVEVVIQQNARYGIPSAPRSGRRVLPLRARSAVMAVAERLRLGW